MIGAVKIIKCIRDRVLRLRLFEVLCESVGSQHPISSFMQKWYGFREDAFLHVFLIWGKKQINFYVSENSPSKELLSKKMWTGKLAYLADIFSRLKVCSSSPLGYFINIFTVYNKTFKRSWFFCNRCLQKSDIDMFASLQDFMVSTFVDTKSYFLLLVKT